MSCPFLDLAPPSSEYHLDPFSEYDLFSEYRHHSSAMEELDNLPPQEKEAAKSFAPLPPSPPTLEDLFDPDQLFKFMNDGTLEESPASPEEETPTHLPEETPTHFPDETPIPFLGDEAPAPALAAEDLLPPLSVTFPEVLKQKEGHVQLAADRWFLFDVKMAGGEMLFNLLEDQYLAGNQKAGLEKLNQPGADTLSVEVTNEHGVLLRGVGKLSFPDGYLQGNHLQSPSVRLRMKKTKQVASGKRPTLLSIAFVQTNPWGQVVGRYRFPEQIQLLSRKSRDIRPAPY